MMATRRPSFPIVRTDDMALNSFADAVRESLERMTGQRGDPMERMVTLGDLKAMGFDVSGALAQRGNQAALSQGLTQPTASTTITVDADAMARDIYNTSLFQNLIASFDNPDRFAFTQDQLRKEMIAGIAGEAAKRKTGITSVENVIIDATREFASRMDEITARFADTAAGVRQLSFAYADADRAIASNVTQVQAQIAGVAVPTSAIYSTLFANLAALKAALPTGTIGTYYKVINPVSGQPDILYKWNGTAYEVAGQGTTATGYFAGVEQILRASADRTTGAEARATLKLTAGKAIAGYDISTTSNLAGVTTSEFVIQADTFAVVPSGYANTGPIDVRYVPFGVDLTGIYMNSDVRIDGDLLVTGSIKSGKLGTGAVGPTNFATGIEPITIVSSVPLSKVTNTIFNTADGKMYRWNGSAYVASIPASDLAGAITSTQITDGAITTPKMTANSISGSVIAAGTLTADKIEANSITAGQIRAGAISASELSADAIDGKTITGATVRTAAANQRVVMDASGMKAWNSSGALTFDLATSGSAQFYATSVAAIEAFGSAGVGCISGVNSSTGYGLYGSSVGGFGVVGVGGSGAAACGGAFWGTGFGAATYLAATVSGITYGIHTAGIIKSVVPSPFAPIDVASTVMCPKLTSEALGDGTFRYKLSGVNTSGSSTVTFSGTNKPGATSGANCTWLKLMIDSTAFWVPVWND